jgi:hypothetical protein
MAQLREWCAEERGRAAALARELGVKDSTFSDWLAGRTCPSAPKILRIVVRLGIRLRRSDTQQ